MAAIEKSKKPSWWLMRGSFAFGLLLLMCSFWGWAHIPVTITTIIWAVVLVVALFVVGLFFLAKFWPGGEERQQTTAGGHAHVAGHNGGEHPHESNLVPIGILVCFVVVTIAYLFHVGHEYGQPPTLSTWNQRVPSSSAASAVAETVSTRPVPFKAPVETEYAIEGESGFHVIVCRASDVECTEEVPIGYRMRCVTMANELVDWSPTACRSFVRLLVQSTGTEPVAMTYHYSPS